MSIGINGRGPFANDLIKQAELYTSSGSYSGWRLIAAAHVTVDPSSDTYRDASLVALSNGTPTQFPSDGGALFLSLGSSWPNYRLGTYDVTFAPGLEWSFNGNGHATRTAYDSASGTATIVIMGSGSGPILITFTGYNGVARTLPPSGLWMRCFKQGVNTAKRVVQAYKDALAPFAGGHIRLMETQKINRAATANVTYGTLNSFPDDNALTWAVSFQPLPPEVLIEMAADCGMTPWDNLYDLANDSALISRATRSLAALPAGMNLTVEYSNEMWNFGAAFSQSSGLNSRATEAGVGGHIQYSRELKSKIAIYEAVFTGANASRLKPVAAWQSTTDAATWAAMLNEGNLYQKIYGVAIAPYAGGGIGGYSTGDYNDTSSISKANRDIVVTDAGAFKTAAFAGLRLALEAAMGQWKTTVELLRSYCVAKGLEATALRPMTYEHAPHHIVESNTPTANSQQALTRQSFAEMLRDGRMAALATEQLERLHDVGADLCYFDLASTAQASSMGFGIWGLMDTITDTSQEPYASVASYCRSPTQRARKHARIGLLI